MKPTEPQADDRRALLRMLLVLFGGVGLMQVCFLLGVMVGKQ